MSILFTITFSIVSLAASVGLILSIQNCILTKHLTILLRLLSLKIKTNEELITEIKSGLSRIEEIETSNNSGVH